MKKMIYTSCLIAFTAALLSGCVHRTVTREPQHRGGKARTSKERANDPYAEVIEEKRVWVWQKEFRNP